jgi:nucleotide-binding universal stress UspA family protein
MKMNFSHSGVFKRLLVPIDFSEESQFSVKYAIGLAQALEAQLILFHAIHVPLNTGDRFIDLMSLEQMKKMADAKLVSLQDKCKNESGFDDIEVISMYGLAVDAICEAVDANCIDLLIMTTNGADGMEEILINSNTAKVTSHCSCPVMVIPNGMLFNLPKRILFATDYAENDFQSIYQLSECFRVFTPEIVVVHVETNGSHRLELERLMKFKNQLKANIPYNKISFNFIKGKNIELALNEYFEKEKYDFISLSMRHRTLFDRFTSRSISGKLINHLKIPLIVFHALKKVGTPLFL